MFHQGWWAVHWLPRSVGRKRAGRFKHAGIFSHDPVETPVDDPLIHSSEWHYPWTDEWMNRWQLLWMDTHIYLSIFKLVGRTHLSNKCLYSFFKHKTNKIVRLWDNFQTESQFNFIGWENDNDDFSKTKWFDQLKAWWSWFLNDNLIWLANKISSQSSQNRLGKILPI